MLLGMVERKMPIDCVLFCDTGIEFPQMYEHIRKVEEAVGIPITRVKSEQSYEYLMLECPIERKDNSLSTKQGGNSSNGYSWAGPKMRWCTSRLKDAPREKFLKPLREKYDVREFVGIAADEAWRCKDERYPLVEWGITEAQALQACYDRGFDFGGLYEIYHRASCWCCPFQRIDELRKLRKHHPELWEKLLELDRRALAQFGTGPLGQFKQNWSVKRLDTRFAEEDGQTG